MFKTNEYLAHGEDLVIVTSHTTTCKKCSPWGGKILSLTGETKGYPTMEEAKASGLFHPNCRHTYSLWLEEDIYDEFVKEDVQKKEQNNKINMDVFKKGTTRNKYDEYFALIEKCTNKNIQRMYVSHADDLSKVLETQKRGFFCESSKIIEWRVRPQEYIDAGQHKYSTLAHEYGHAFDVLVKFDGLTYKEINRLKEALGLGETASYSLQEKPSLSDVFLDALRKDKKLLRHSFADLKKDVSNNDHSTAGVQDCVTGFWGKARTGMHHYHEESYWNRWWYNTFIENGLDDKFVIKKNKDILKKVFKELGLEVNNQALVKQQCRIYETASETWANITSAVTTESKELDSIKKYLPNTYNAYLEIIKKAKE
ncbi:MAG: phage minor capsid protein [Synergistaceae bacterium]